MPRSVVSWLRRTHVKLDAGASPPMANPCSLFLVADGWVSSRQEIIIKSESGHILPLSRVRCQRLVANPVVCVLSGVPFKRGVGAVNHVCVSVFEQNGG